MKSYTHLLYSDSKKQKGRKVRTFNYVKGGKRIVIKYRHPQKGLCEIVCNAKYGNDLYDAFNEHLMKDGFLSSHFQQYDIWDTKGRQVSRNDPASTL